MHILYHRIRLPLATLLSLLGVLCLMAGNVSAHTALPAHAKVDKAIPAIGSTVTQAPTRVTVFALENLNPDPKKSNLFVYGPNGELISQGNATVSLSNPQEMAVPIKPNPSSSDGVYVVQWITVSALDGDPDQGAFVFTVKAGAATATPTPEATTSTPTPLPTIATGQTTPSTNSPIPDTEETPLWVPIVVGVLALLIGLGGGFGLGRRNAAPRLGAMRRTVAQQQQEEESSKRT